MTMRSKAILSRTRQALILFGVVLIISGCQFSWPWTKKIDLTRATPDGLYQQGVAYYQDGSFKKSVEVFQRLKEEYPLSKFAIMAELGIADSHFSNKDWPEAELAYTEFLNLHPTNENLPYVLYQFAFLAEKMIRDCKKTLGEQEFYVGEFYFNIKRYRAALRRFEKVARDYPNVGLDYKVSYYIIETKRRLADAGPDATSGVKGDLPIQPPERLGSPPARRAP
jgi:outer membrane protein assembly factor BamD